MTPDRPGLSTMGEASPGFHGATPDDWRAKLGKRVRTSKKAWRVRKRMLAARAQSSDDETVSRIEVLSKAA